MWTQDVHGNEVAVDQPPSGVGLRNFGDDKYRSLMYFARDIGFTAGCATTPDRPDELLGDRRHHRTRTAAELGALTAWNDGKAAENGEFGKLSKPYSDESTGKIAYALQYKNAR